MRLVLHDLDAERAARTARYAAHVAEVTRSGWAVDTVSELDPACKGADFVVVCISTGGLTSMGADLALSARYGVAMPIGDTVGPAGISRAWRNVPVFAVLADAMTRVCPDAWLLNVTNPLTALTRTVTQTSDLNVVGLCHEVTNATFFLSQLLDCAFSDVDVTATGINHLPLITGLRVNGVDRWPDLLDLAHGHADTTPALPLLDRVLADPPVHTGGDPRRREGGWTKQALLDEQAVNYEVLRRFGALPAADSDHTCEFFPQFTPSRWDIRMVTVEDRAGREARYLASLDAKLTSTSVPMYRSPEMVAPVIEGLLGGRPATLPLNIPNAGQCPDLPDGRVVESMCVVDTTGVRGRDRASAPPLLADWLRRVSTSQELTVEAALTGDDNLLLAALLADPAAGQLDIDRLVSLRDDIVGANRAYR
jgi:alpha-galactosidase